MSWKLAELRWRHDIGLYESRWDKESGALPVERKRAIEAFGKTGRRSRSLSASRDAAKSNLAIEKDVSLGKPVMPASSAFRSSVEVITHERSPAQRAPGPQLSSSSLAPLLQTRSNCSTDHLAPEGVSRRDDLLGSHPTAHCHSSSAFSSNSSEVCSPSPDRAQHLEGEPNETFFFFDVERGQVASPESEELDHLLSHQDSGLSTTRITEKLLSSTPPALSQVVSSLPSATQHWLICARTPLPERENLEHHSRNTLEPSVVERFGNLLELEGAVFELLNHSDNNNLWIPESTQDSSEIRWTSTASKHRSTSSLLLSNNMAEDIDPPSETSRPAVSQDGVASEDSADAKPHTPKRRMTPIYDDYQTAVSMIRSGTPKLPTSPLAADKYACIPVGEIINLPKTPDRRYSYSMTDVHRKLAESHNDLDPFPVEGHTLKQSATSFLPPEQERTVSIPVFPWRDPDSDDDNEKLIARGEYPPEGNEENPAGIELEHDDIPLRDMEHAEVRSRARGDPVSSQEILSSQEIHASSADFDYADDSNIDVSKLATTGSARGSGSTPTETSIVGRIVDQYRTDPDGKMDNTYDSTDAALFLKQSSAEIGGCKDDAKPVYVPQPSSRAAVDVGPAPSWPLPAPPPALPPRSSKRRNSSGMLLSPGGYGNTSGLLNTKLSDMSNLKITSSGILGLSKGTPPKKFSKSSSDLTSENEADVGESDGDDVDRPEITRLSHVLEESSGRSRSSDDFGRMNAVGYIGKSSRKEGGPGLVTGAGDVTAAHMFHEVEAAKGWSPAHRTAENVLYPSGLSTRRVRRRRGMDLGAGNKFGSLDQILAGQLDSDDETLDIVDTSDWETIHDSRSQNNLQYDDAAKEGMPVIRSDKLHSIDSLSLKEAPVSTWDPLSKNTPGFDRSENELGALLKSHKESTQNKQVDMVGRAGTNNPSAPKLGVRAEGSFSLPGSANSESVQHPVPSHDNFLISQVNKPEIATQVRYRHPAPLQSEHKHPFAGKRPVLPAVRKAQSTSSSETMAEQIYTHENRNIDATSSVAADSGVSVSATSEEEHNRRVRAERNRRILAEIDLYDPDRVRPRRHFPEARLTVDRRVRRLDQDPVFVATQRRIGWWFRWAAVILYPLGTFLFLWAISRRGSYSNDAMLQVSRLGGNRVVAVFHEDDILWAQKAQEVMWRVYLVVLAGCVVFLAWALHVYWLEVAGSSGVSALLAVSGSIPDVAVTADLSQ